MTHPSLALMQPAPLGLSDNVSLMRLTGNHYRLFRSMLSPRKSSREPLSKISKTLKELEGTYSVFLNSFEQEDKPIPF